MQLTKEQKIAITKFLKEGSAALTRVEAERDFIKTSRQDLSEELDMNKKVLSRLLKAYHKGNFELEKSEFTEFEDLFTAITDE